MGLLLEDFSCLQNDSRSRKASLENDGSLASLASASTKDKISESDDSLNFLVLIEKDFRFQRSLKLTGSLETMMERFSELSNDD